METWCATDLVKALQERNEIERERLEFDKDKAEIESVNNNGKKTLSLIINGGYSMKVDY